MSRAINMETSLVVHWLRLSAPNALDLGFTDLSDRMMAMSAQVHRLGQWQSSSRGGGHLLGLPRASGWSPALINEEVCSIPTRAG